MRTFLVLVLSCLSYSVFSQWKQPTYAVPSANVATLGTFTEIPVSHFTGTPNISVPLYEVKGSRVGLPITLSYHPSSVKVDMHPGWTGMGWGLSVGGAITRKMNSLPDEYQTGDMPQPSGHYYMPSTLQDPLWASGLSNFNKYPLLVNLHPTDLEPDEFSFSFLGMSGKFFYDQSGHWRVQSDQYLKVVVNPSDIDYPTVLDQSYYIQPTHNNKNFLSKAFRKFTLIDAKGNQYVFGSDDETAVEYSDDIAPREGRRAEGFFATSWHLTKIISADGAEEMTLTYNRGPYNSYLFRAYSSTYTNNPNNGFLSVGCGNSSTANKLSGRVTSPVYLSTIEMPSQHLKIEFKISKANDLVYPRSDYNLLEQHQYGDIFLEAYAITGKTTGINYIGQEFREGNDDASKRFIWRKLDWIKVRNTSMPTSQAKPDANVLRRIDFTYRENTTSRLRLNEVSIRGADDGAVQKYSFAYYDEVLMPAYLEKIGDHWGFNNDINQHTAANFNPPFLTLKAPSEAATKKEVLKSLTYPTGGTTEFEFEINRYGHYVPSLRSNEPLAESGIAGGLRVRKIKMKDGYGKEVVKEYFYVTGYTHDADPATKPSSGILDAKPQYYFSTTGTAQNGSTFSYEYFSSNPVIPLTQNSTGTHIGYTEVVERNGDGSYTIYRYTNHLDPIYRDEGPVDKFNQNQVAFMPHTSKDFERGRLEEKTDFSSTGAMVSHTTFTYAKTNPSAYATRAMENRFYPVCDNNAGSQFVSRAGYYLYYYPFYLSKKLEKTFSSTNAIEIETDYVVDAYRNVTTEKIKTSKGDVLSTALNYPYHFSSSSTTYAGMVTKNMVSLPVERRLYRQSSGNSVLLSADLNTYIAGGNTFVNNEYHSFKPLSPAVPASLPAYDPSTGVPAPYKKEAQFTYDEKANLSTVKKENDLTTRVIYSTKESFLIAEIKNASLRVLYSSFDHLGSTDPVSGSEWTYPLAKVQQGQGPVGGKVFKLDDVQLSAQHLSSSTTYTLSYWYRTGASVTVATAGGGTVGAITKTFTKGAWTYAERTVSGATTVNVSGTGFIDEVRLYPKGAQMATFAHVPLVGLVAACDMNSRTVYYLYDGFQRLSLLKDIDGNVLKKYCYNYWQQPEECYKSTANWVLTGNKRCKPCPSNPVYTTNIEQVEEKDENDLSETAGQTRWVDVGTSPNCASVAALVPTGTVQCEVFGVNDYTGWQLVEVKDMNPCSNTYLQVQTNPQLNLSACPPSRVFARIELSNYVTYFHETYADVTVAFYLDSRCTVPANVNNLTFRMHSNAPGRGGVTVSNTQNYTANGSGYSFGSMLIASFYEDEFGNTHSFSQELYLIELNNGYYILDTIHFP